MYELSSGNTVMFSTVSDLVLMAFILRSKRQTLKNHILKELEFIIIERCQRDDVPALKTVV